MKVIPLGPRADRINEQVKVMVCTETVKLLEHHLELARAGEVQFCMVIAEVDDQVLTDWASVPESPHTMLGVIECAKYDLMVQCIE